VSRKRVFGLAFLLALVGMLLVLGIGFESEAVKARLIEVVRAETGRELRIDGALRLRFLPHLAVAVDSLRLSGAEGADSEPFLTVKTLNGVIKIIPLLRGKVMVNQIEIHGIEVSMARYADGATSFDDLLALKSEGESKSSWEVEVEKIILLGGKVSWRDEMKGRHLEVDQISFQSGPLGKRANGRLELRGHLREQGSMVLTSHYWINVDEAEKTFVQLEDLRVSARESGGASPFRLELTGRRARAMATGLELEQLAVEGEVREGDTDWKARFKLADLKTDTEGGALHGLTGEVRQLQNGAPLLAIEGKLDVLTGTGRDWQGILTLDGKGDLAGHAFTGALSVPLKMVLEENARIAVEGWRGTLEIQPGPPLARAVRIQAEGELKAAMEGAPQAEGQLALTVDDASRLKAVWKLERLEPPHLWFEADLDTLNLDHYLKPAPDSAGATAPENKSPTPEQEPPESAEPVESPGEAALSIEGRLRIGELKYQETTLTGLAGEVRLQNGKLEIQELAEPPMRKNRTKL